MSQEFAFQAAFAVMAQVEPVFTKQMNFCGTSIYQRAMWERKHQKESIFKVKYQGWRSQLPWGSFWHHPPAVWVWFAGFWVSAVGSLLQQLPQTLFLDMELLSLAIWPSWKFSERSNILFLFKPVRVGSVICY